MPFYSSSERQRYHSNLNRAYNAEHDIDPCLDSSCNGESSVRRLQEKNFQRAQGRSRKNLTIWCTTNTKLNE